MAKPAARVLALLELLQARGQVSGAELAQLLEVDGRTVRRYVAALEEMGIPIVAERGRAGGYALVAGFKLPPMMFSEDEALALSVGLLAARSLGLERAAPAIAGAQAKLERTMPAVLRQRLQAIAETVQLGLRRPSAAAGQAALGQLSVAARSGRRVQLDYVDAAGKASTREFDPYGLAFHDGCWYAVGWCHLRVGLRSFRLDRIREIGPLETGFERPAGFDALGYLVRSVATLPRAWTVEVLLETTLERAQAQFFDTIGVFEQVEDGVVMHNQSDDIDWFARQLAGLPFGFEIRNPPALRAAVRTCAEGLLRQL
jgi:predicted DNA-binding transcriptional regulator YafY